VEKALGPEHRHVGVALNDLAELYMAQGRFAEAEPLQKRRLIILENALGATHPDVAVALNDLALLYHHLERFAEAEPLFKRSLAIRRK
jgi:tetratricopeptide (TPR) repeat protein